MIDRWQELAAQAKRSAIVVNLYGGPGTGKSTTAALIFGELKRRNYNVELVTEFAKDLVWEGRSRALSNQVYVLGKQCHRIQRLIDQVDVIVTDSPVMLAPVYTDWDELANLAHSIHERWNTLDVFIKRDNDSHPYRKAGRYQTLAQAEALDRQIRGVLEDYGVSYIEFRMGLSLVDNVCTLVEEHLQRVHLPQ